MTDVPIVQRVIGDGPVAGIGAPALTIVDERSRSVAVGGDLGLLPRSGGATANRNWTGRRVGVYEREGLRCRHLVRSRYPVQALAFHPALPQLAVGTGSYDGGHSYEGELLLLRLDSGHVVSALRHPRKVLSVEWRSGRP